MRISEHHRRHPETVLSREEAVTRFARAIGAKCPEYSPEELRERSEAWADKAIASGAIVIGVSVA